ncbi:hypothetical protein Tco_1149779 [Tanacetum coccineum]
MPQIPSPPLPSILSPLPVSSPLPASPIRPLGYRAAMIRRAEAASTSHSLPLPPPIILSHTRSDAPLSGTPPLLSIPLPTSSPPLHLLSTDHKADRPEVTLPPRKRLDTYEIYTRLDDEQTERQLMAGQLNMLYRDRRTHARTARLIEGGSTAGSDYRVTGSGPQEIGDDYRDVGSGPQETSTVH